ncbi:MAG: AbrB family transcriptional regulator [Pseudomonadota bacterium]|nr:AbrB family transcriptional regulator [Pseudomonadota bacterium]
MTSESIGYEPSPTRVDPWRSNVSRSFKLEAGHRVEFIETDARFLVKPATRDIRSLKGILPKPRRAVSIEDMNRSISRMGRIR